MGYSAAYKFGKLWFKYRKRSDGSKDILLGERPEDLVDKNFEGADYVGHDHYYFKNDDYYVQLRANRNVPHKKDKKHHLYKTDKLFKGDDNFQKVLEDIFVEVETIVKTEELREEIEMINKGSSSVGKSLNREIKNNLNSVMYTLNKPLPSDSGFHARAEEDELILMHNKVGEFRDEVTKLLNEVCIKFIDYKENRTWFDTRHFSFYDEFLLPVYENLKTLINIDYDNFEDIVIDKIRRSGEITETYVTANKLSDLAFVELQISRPENNNVGLTSRSHLAEFVTHLKGFLAKVVEEANNLIAHYNRLPQEDKWDDVQHAEYGEYFQVLNQKLQNIIDSIEDSIKEIQGEMLPAYEAYGIPFNN